MGARVIKRYANSDFAFVLPGEWPYRDESDATTRITAIENPNAPARLTVSLRRFTPDTPPAVVAQAFTEFVRLRRAAEVEVSEDPEDVLLTEESIVDGGAFLYSKYAGIHGSAERRFAALLTAENGKMLCFYVESNLTSDEYFNSLTNDILDSIEVH